MPSPAKIHGESPAYLPTILPITSPTTLKDWRADEPHTIIPPDLCEKPRCPLGSTSGSFVTNLYKYLPEQFVRPLLCEGAVLFRALSYFRDYEDAQVRGDEFEGTKLYRPTNGLEVTLVETQRLCYPIPSNPLRTKTTSSSSASVPSLAKSWLHNSRQTSVSKFRIPRCSFRRSEALCPGARR